MVMALINEKMRIEDLLVHKDVAGNPTFQNSLITATLTQMPIENIIL